MIDLQNITDQHHRKHHANRILWDFLIEKNNKPRTDGIDWMSWTKRTCARYSCYCSVHFSANFHHQCIEIKFLVFFPFFIFFFFFLSFLAVTYMALDRKHEIRYFISIIHTISYWSRRVVMEKVGANCKMLAATKTTENMIGKWSISTSHRI